MVTPVSNAQVATAGLLQFCFTGTATDTGWHVRRFQVRTSQPCTLDTVITVRFYATNPIIASTPKKIFAAAACEADLLDTLIITNTGNEKLIIPTKPTIAGADAADFSILSPQTWPDTIPVGGRLSLVISFAPDQSLRQKDATITFTNNDKFPQKNPWVIQLQGVRESGKLDYSTRKLDLGSFCLDAAPIRGAVAISNIGNGTSRIVSVTPLDQGTPVVITSNPAGRNLASASKDSVVFQAQPVTSGPFTARYLVKYDPCSVTDTLVVTGTANSVLLTATPAQFDFGSQPIGIAATRTIQIVNNGNVPARITSLQLKPLVAGVTITNPTPPFIIPPGGNQQVTVSLTASSEDPISTSVIAIAETDCRDTLEAKVEGAGVSAALFATRSSIDFGSLVDCGNLPVRDTLSVWNLGTAPLEVKKIEPASGSTARYIITTAKSIPHTLQPGDLLSITVDLISGTSGTTPDELVVTSDDPKRPEIRIPLRSTILTAELSYTLPSGNTGDTLSFATLYDCRNSDEQSVRLTNSGMTPDTIELVLAQPEFTVVAPGSLQFILPPGTDTTIQIRALLPNPGRFTGELLVRSLPCSINRSVPLVAEHIKVEASLTDVTFTPVFIDQQPTQDASLINTGDADQTIERIELVDPSGNLTLIGSYNGTTLPVGADIPLPVKFTPTGPGTATATLRVIISKPCRYTLVATITASATDDRYVVRAFGPAARGRWGTHVEVPVKFENTRSARFDTLQLSMTTSSQLLDPTGMIHAQPGISARMVKYDPSTGKLEMELVGDGQNNSFLTTDTLVSVEFDVLRGNEIMSPIELEFLNLPNNVEGQSTAGDFALEDYCDAHGRLLEVNGIIQLKQNVPNPFNPTTVIEFETAFSDHVVLTLHNDVGQEVGRLVDEVLPAGRRHITVDASNLPSGVYTYRLRTGLQVLSRQMIVTK
jgi:hypothetical protein